MPKLMGHFASGHVTLVMAVAWTPWLLLAERKRQTGELKLGFLPGLTLGVIALADVRWAALGGLLWLAYSLYEWTANRPHRDLHDALGRGRAGAGGTGGVDRGSAAASAAGIYPAVHPAVYEPGGSAGLFVPAAAAVWAAVPGSRRQC